MSTKAKTEIDLTGSAGGLRSEPGGRAQRPAGAARLRGNRPPLELPDEVRDRLADEYILLGMLCVPDSVAARVLAELDVSLHATQAIAESHRE